MVKPTTTIEWTHHRFNAWKGCAKAHPGCTNCYAEALPPKMRGGARWGEVYAGGTRPVAPDGYWNNPVAWARSAARAGERHRVFCASVSDVLEVPALHPVERWRAKTADAVGAAAGAMAAARERLWGLIQDTANMCPRTLLPHSGENCSCISHGPRDPGLDWLLLTKRPENWPLVPEDVRRLVWLGTSVSDQETADEWGSRLRRAPGFGLRFLSVEPLLGPVNLAPLLDVDLRGDDWTPIDWVIVGGESGRKARPCEVEWVRDVVRQCRSAGVPVFVKQLGANYADAENGVGGVLARPPPEYGPLTRRLADKKGGDMAEWPEDLRVRELPEVSRA